jgi:hypothetical protein
MRRRREPVRVRLDAKSVATLPDADIRAILRAADDLIAIGGRSLLTKILRGSRASDVLKHGLDRNPSHGYYRGVPEEEVLAKIDWMILHQYLRIEYKGQLPVLVFAPAGWRIEREAIADEIIVGFDQLLASTARPYAMEYLKDRNRGMILLVLDKVQDSGDPKYVPVLEDWERIDYKKVREKIQTVIAHLRAGDLVAHSK